MSDQDIKNDAYWRERLSEEEYRICREKGTEGAFSGVYWDEKGTGQYLCKCCKTPLFNSNTKYDSGSGWPSFYQPIDKDGIIEEMDNSHGMSRIEIKCKNCNSHLGHVFTDGPQPTGLRYCVNSASLSLEEQNAKDEVGKE